MERESPFQYLCKQNELFNHPAIRLEVKRLQDAVLAEFEQDRTDLKSVKTYVSRNYFNIETEDTLLKRELLLPAIIEYTWVWWRSYGPGKSDK